MIRCCNLLPHNDDIWPQLSHLAPRLCTGVRLYRATNWVFSSHKQAAQGNDSCLNDRLSSFECTNLNLLHTSLFIGGIGYDAVLLISNRPNEATIRGKLRPGPCHLSFLPYTAVSVAAMINMLPSPVGNILSILAPSSPPTLQVDR